MTRGRKPNVVPTEEIHLRLRRDLLTRLRMLHYSEAEQRVPYGALNKFFEELIVRSLDFSQLDLAPYTGCLPGIHTIRAEAATIELLRKTLEQEHGTAN